MIFKKMFSMVSYMCLVTASLFSIANQVCKYKLSNVIIKHVFAYAKTKAEISCTLTAHPLCFPLIDVQSLLFPNSKFQASSHLLSLYSLVCVGPGRKLCGQVFLCRSSIDFVR